MAAEAYADSSFLVSLYRADGGHEKASAFMARAALPLAFTPLHRIEVRNALRNAAAAGDMTFAEQRTAFRQIEEDLREGLLIPTPVDWTELLKKADLLSEKHAAAAGQRTIDLLHVAAALELSASLFLSFDVRQRRLVKAAGLEAAP
jgi:predicted nucleic acid-binding protein